MMGNVPNIISGLGSTTSRSDFEKYDDNEPWSVTLYLLLKMPKIQRVEECTEYLKYFESDQVDSYPYMNECNE
jgi:hypothetical protein